MNKKEIEYISIALLIIILSSITPLVWAQNIGFNQAVQGGVQSGLAGAGCASSFDNASMFYNPANLVFSGSSAIQIQSVLNYKQQKFIFNNIDTTNDLSANSINQNLSIFLHNRCQTCGDSSKYAFGFAFYTPQNFSSSWNNDWSGAYHYTNFNFKTIVLQPTVSIKVTKNYAIGIGVDVARNKLNLNKVLNKAPYQILEKTSLLGSGIGFNIGSYFKLNNKLAIAANIKTPINIKYNSGKIKYSYIPSTLKDSLSDAEISSKILLPGTICIGISYKPNKKYEVLMDLNFLNNSSMDTVKISGTNALGNIEKEINLNMRNALSINTGIIYKRNLYTLYRLGIGINIFNKQNTTQYIAALDANNINISAGISKNYDKVNFHLSMMYSMFEIKNNTLHDWQMDGTIIQNSVSLSMAAYLKFE